jgi:hypothetical protein
MCCVDRLNPQPKAVILCLAVLHFLSTYSTLAHIPTGGVKMTDKKSNKSRRKLLKSIAAGSGAVVAAKSLPESWNRPVVDSVMLPAHAQTSPSAGVCLAAPGNQTFIATGSGATGSLQSFTVPANCGLITIEAWGAEGGSSPDPAPGGLGARMRGDFIVTPGDVLTILVGQLGGQGPGRSSSGGGGSFVVDSGNNPMLVAGGGGGAFNAVAGGDGQTGTGGGGALGGAGGSGGGATPNPSDTAAGSGGGFTGDGADNQFGFGGSAFLNGGSGGTGGNGSIGGYGGGGNNSNNASNNGGGGGGYSGGGGGGTTPGASGGGGSFNAGTNQSNSAGVQSGDGQVTINWG